ncbi:uncharacterized protein V3H82_021645 isoform 3-T4 [Fundulus diaphanus]
MPLCRRRKRGGQAACKRQRQVHSSDNRACFYSGRLSHPSSSLCLPAATAAAQTPKTKPKARAQVARGQRSDGDEEDSLRDQCPVSLIRVTGTVSWADPRGSASRQATASDGASLDPSDLCKQMDEMKLQTERERSKNTRDVHQPCILGLPGSRAPDCPLSGVRRTRCLHRAGILPQEQIRVKGFSGTPFRLP